MHINDAPPELRMRCALLGKPIAPAGSGFIVGRLGASCFACSWLVNRDNTHCQKFPIDPDPHVGNLINQICMDWTP